MCKCPRIDDDDISFSQRFEKQIAFLKKHPEITAVGCAFSSNPSGRGNNIFFPEDLEELKTLTFIQVPIVHPCAMIRSSFLEQHNIRYVDDYPNAEDMPFWRDVTLKHNGLISNLQDVLLFKKANAAKTKNYNRIQARSVSKYRQDTFDLFLKQGKHCGDMCACYTALRKSGAVKNLIRSDALDKKINAVCPPPNALHIKHPQWNDFLVIDTPDAAHRHNTGDKARIINQTPSHIMLKWDRWGTETFVKQSNGTYTFESDSN